MFCYQFVTESFLLLIYRTVERRLAPLARRRRSNSSLWGSALSHLTSYTRLRSLMMLVLSVPPFEVEDLSSPHNVQKRQCRRYPCLIETSFAALSPLDGVQQDPHPVVGVCENIGDGGVGIISDRLIPQNTVLRTEFSVEGCSVSIPTLMKVQWLQTVVIDGCIQHKMGLQFLI